MQRATRSPATSLRHHLPLLLALALAAAALAPALVVEGIVATRAGGDSPFLLVRVQQMASALAAGHIPARWMPDASYGLGYPFWNYYAPLAYLFAGLVAILGGGVVGAIKVTQLAAFLVAAAGAYRLADELWQSHSAALVASAAYTFAPYHMVNVYVRGDALAELAAFAVFPWVLVAVDRVRVSRTADGVVALALAFAALLVSHNISALLFLPVLLAYLVWRNLPAPAWARLSDRPVSVPPQANWRRAPRGVPAADLVAVERLWAAPAGWTLRALLGLERRLWPWRRVRRGKGALAVGIGLLLGLALAAWFWVPALFERDAVQLASNLTGYFHYGNHFRGLDLVDLAPTFDYAIGDGGCGPCRMGGVQLLVAAFGVVAGLRVVGKRGALAFWLLVALGATFMITPLGRLALRRPLPAGVAVVVAATLAATMLGDLRVETLNVDQVTLADTTAFEVFSGNIGSTVRAEYLPRAVMPRPMNALAAIYGRAGDPRAVSGFLDGSTLHRHKPTLQEWRIDAADDITTTVAFPTLAFPGWVATIDGGPVQLPGVVDGSGFLTVAVPPGSHNVVLRLDRSGPRAVAEGLSVLALLLAMTLLLANRRRRWLYLLGPLAVLLVAAVLLAHALPVGQAEGPVTLDFSRTPYPHHNPNGVAFGSSRLVAATLTGGLAKAGESMLVNLIWEEPWAGWQVEAALVSPAEPIFRPARTGDAGTADPGAPDVRARVDQNQGDTGAMTLEIPDDVPTGLYFVRLRVSDGDGYVSAQSAAGFDLGDVYLGPVRIRGKGVYRDVPTAPVARMGDIRLHAVQPVQDAGALEVRLVWETDRELAVNYKTSVRLLDPNEQVIAQNDKEPLYGFYPTTAWRQGEQILDKRWLAIPPDTVPGDRYMIEVVLYDEFSGEELGTGRVSGVKVERPLAESSG